MNTTDIADAMIKYGGSFIEALGKALLLADNDNAQRIKEAFPDYWEAHEELSKMGATRKSGDDG